MGWLDIYKKDYDYELDYWEEERIKELLLYRRIVEVRGDTLILDNGVQLEVRGNEGCGGCASGNYDVTEINTCFNAITDVEFECEPTDEIYDEQAYRIYVLSADERTKVVQVEGTDGNGYYGTGYSIRVKLTDEMRGGDND